MCQVSRKQQATSHEDPTEGSAGMLRGRSVFCHLARNGRQSAAGERLNQEHNSLLSGGNRPGGLRAQSAVKRKVFRDMLVGATPKDVLCPRHTRRAASFWK